MLGSWPRGYRFADIVRRRVTSGSARNCRAIAVRSGTVGFSAREGAGGVMIASLRFISFGVPAISMKVRLAAGCAIVGGALLSTSVALGHVLVTSPERDSVLLTGSRVELTWVDSIQHDTQAYHIDFYWMPGGEPMMVAQGIPAEQHSYEWMTPTSPCSECYLVVTQENTGTDYSDRLNLQLVDSLDGLGGMGGQLGAGDGGAWAGSGATPGSGSDGGGGTMTAGPFSGGTGGGLVDSSGGLGAASPSDGGGPSGGLASGGQSTGPVASEPGGGCSVAPIKSRGGGFGFLAALLVGALVLSRRRRAVGLDVSRV